MRHKRMLAVTAAIVTVTGGMLMVGPASPARAWDQSCAGRGWLEVDYFDGGMYCDAAHGTHRVTINSCDVEEIDAGANWVAFWWGDNMQHLQYMALSPGGELGSSVPYCVGDVAVNP